MASPEFIVRLTILALQASDDYAVEEVEAGVRKLIEEHEHVIELSWNSDKKELSLVVQFKAASGLEALAEVSQFAQAVEAELLEGSWPVSITIRESQASVEANLRNLVRGAPPA